MLRRKRIDPIEADGIEVENAVAFIESFTSQLERERDNLEDLENKMSMRADDHRSIVKVYEVRRNHVSKAKEKVSRLLELITAGK